MKKFLLFVLALFIVYTGAAQETIVQFNVSSKKELSKISKIISIDNYDKGKVTAYACNPRELAEFKALGYEYEILPHPSHGKVINMATSTAQMANWDRYPTYEVYVEMMNQFETDYPNLCQVVSIGTSVEDRELLAVKISDNVSTHEAEPEFFYTGTMHGDEATGFVLLLRLADWLLSNYGTNTDATYIVDNFELYINPAANPDGTYNGGNHTVASSTRSNTNGVDLNRNFPKIDGSQSNIQAETQAMMNFAADRRFVVSANFHGGIELANYPWDTWTEGSPDYHPHPDANWWLQVATDYAESCQTNSPSGYFDDYGGVVNGGDWYVVDDGRQDYMNYYHHCREMTLEISGVKLLSSDELPAHWDYNFEAMLNYIKTAEYGFNGSVTNTNGDPLDATIEILSHDAENSHVVTDLEHGNYYRPVAPGTYNVRYSSLGYISQTHSVNVSSWESISEKNVILEAATQVSLSGTVTDAETSLPLEGVQISILDASYPDAYTNANGEYIIGNVYEGNYDVRAFKAGYTTVIQNTDILEGSSTLDYSLPVSTAISFEEGIDPIFTYSGNADWFRTNAEAYDGNYSMQSGNISDDQTTALETELNILSAGNISFYKKVSSESGYDYLRFYIDGNQMGEWSGLEDWTQESFDVSAGTHTFKWEYEKDGSVSSNDDCTWIDFIEFPECEQTEYYTVTFVVDDGEQAIQGASVSFNSETKSTTASGEAVFNDVEAGNNLPWTVSATGYTEQSGQLNLIDSDITQPVSLEIATYEITFSVSNGADAIENAEIELEGQGIQYTNPAGETVFTGVPYNIAPGLNYTANAAGYVENSDILIVNSSQIVSVIMEDTNGIYNPNPNDIKIYPNPTNDWFIISYNQQAKIEKIEIFDIFGRKIYETRQTNFQIPVRNLTAGFYSIRIKVEGYYLSKKLIIH